ncbi:asparagine synthase (glutamine-hydrolyzing) [Algoriphagus namhaensis]|uniref:asparagine synthase (glutamine-hydrolyzing) n=1 Tax=Algoriphagus namhaensis TaxID=915353 RepID=A0ABV8ASM3_9BACT
MCGIAGIVSKNRSDHGLWLDEMLQRLKHRGPDGTGVVLKDNFGLAQSRLAIIDLVGGVQPMSDPEGRFWITYNGELYNFLELKGQLSALGFDFRTNSDTEVVLQAYACWGNNCVNHFRGMFAFGILDSLRQELFLARDHFGIKPLFYGVSSDLFAFASELQGLRSIPNIDWSLDHNSIDQFLSYQYIPAPNSVFKGVKKLPPGYFMRVNAEGCIQEITQYWDLDFKPDTSKSERYWLEKVDNAIAESVKSHLIADVPFGAFLSGGVDSSLVVSKMAKQMSSSLKTFCIGFEEDDYSELLFARQIATKYGTDHFEEIVKPDALAILPDLVKHYGEPFGDSSAIPTYYVSKLAKKEVTMVLSGDGGDELFGGYESYTNRWTRHYSPIPEHLPLHKKLAYFGLNKVIPKKYPFRTANLPDWQRYIYYFSEEDRASIWKEEYLEVLSDTDDFIKETWEHANSFSHYHKAQYTDFKTYMPFAVLTKVDIASMMNSLEVRTPLLDLEVVKIASQIPENFNINKHRGEWVGKDILKNLLSLEMGRGFAYRKKMGFGVPLKHWFGEEAKTDKEIQERLLSRGNGLDELFNLNALEQVAFGKKSSQQWLLIFLQEWLSQNK